MGAQQRVLAGIDTLGVSQKRSEVVGENKRGIVTGIQFLISAGITGAQVTLRIVTGPVRRRTQLNTPLPRTLGAVWRNENPFAGQCIESPMRLFKKIGKHGNFTRFKI